MKSKTLLITVLFIFFTKSYSQIEMNSSGNVSVGFPIGGYKFTVFGDTYFRPFGADSRIIIDQYNEEALIGTTDNIYGYIGTPDKQFWKIYSRFIYSNGVLLTSDKRKKENIKFLNSKTCLEKIIKIKSAEYNFKKKLDKNTNEHNKKTITKKEFGFLAQDIEKILPEAVEHNLKNDNYYVNYTTIIPLLVESIKEQQKTIKRLTRKVNKLENKIPNKIINQSKVSKSKNTLSQNTPNPFDKETVISITLENKVLSAILYVRDFNGEPSGEFNIMERGETSITIEANSLKSGIYFYSLLVDGKLIETKRMLIL